jgi:hypothetical protein
MVTDFSNTETTAVAIDCIYRNALLWTIMFLVVKGSMKQGPHISKYFDEC